MLRFSHTFDTRVLSPRGSLRQAVAQLFLPLWWFVAPLAILTAQVPDEPREALSQADELVRSGRAEEAFEACLTIPGGEFAAVSLARGEPDKYLALMAGKRELFENPRSRLVEAELLLASGRMGEAKERFHRIADSGRDGNWGTGRAGYYPVEPPVISDSGSPLGFQIAQGPTVPFVLGPGSHRDNWLLRRLIALDLNEDAASEFARMWKVHQTHAQAYRVRSDPGMSIHPDRREHYHPPGFTNLGLQFALDYAFFLKRVGRPEDAVTVLVEPLLVMDMDRMPGKLVPLDSSAVAGRDAPLRENAVLDRVPFNYLGGRSLGTARKDFIRLSFGELKSVGREGELIRGLRERIDRGENRPRRVLAQIYVHQGQPAEALAMELAYIEHGGFDPVSAAHRRGLVFEEHGKLAEAVTALEQVMVAKPGPLRIPDLEERVKEEPGHENQALPVGNFGGPGDVKNRLSRLYAALGRTDKILEVELAAFDACPANWEQLQLIESIAARFEAAGKEEDFKKWARAKLADTTSPPARACLAWYLSDYDAALKHAAGIDPGERHGWWVWQERFSKIDSKLEREFMRAVTRAHPDDAVARVVLLRLDKPVDDVQTIAAWESLIASPIKRWDRELWKMVGFRDSVDVAYRLARLYEKSGDREKLRALGLRLAKGERPFDEPDGSSWVDGNGAMEYGNACLALAIQHADDPVYQKDLAAALENSRWKGAREQLARRMGSVPPAVAGGASPPWANLPRGVRAIVSCESVTCVARDDRFIYTGLPWGLAVYDFTGTPVTRILLGGAVTSLIASGNEAWAGTDGGLFRIESGSWRLTHEPIGKVKTLGLDGDRIWIGISGDIKTGLMSIHRKTLEMRVFSAEEIGMQRTDFSRFEADGEFLWADGCYGLVRYHHASDSWSVVPNPVTAAREPVRFIGVIDGQVWADVRVDDTVRHRPARLDRKTLQLKPLHVKIRQPVDRHSLYTKDLTFVGRDRGQPVFGEEGDGQRFVVEKDGNFIRYLRGRYDIHGKDEERISDPLPDGVVLPGGRVQRIPNNAWPDGLRAGIRCSWNSQYWPADAVWAVVWDDARQQDWLCAGAGLSILPRNGASLRHYGEADGLIRGPVMAGAELGGMLYFGSGWNQKNGHLTRYDPRTGVFTPWFSADGMDSDRVVGLAVKNDKLELRYGVEFGNDEFTNDRAPGTFDPVTGQFTSGGDKPVRLVEGLLPAPAPNGTLPLLGGPAYRSYQRGDGSTWYCGARGLVIYPTEAVPVVAIPPMNALHVPNADLLQRAEAEKMNLPYPLPIERFKELSAHPNRHVRAAALSRTLDRKEENAAIPILTAALDDPHLNIRAVATIQLAKHKHVDAMPGLRKSLKDHDFRIRSIAAIALAELGEVPDLAFFDEILTNFGESGSYSLEWDVPCGYCLSAEKLYAALAPRADRKVFELLLRHRLLGEYYLESRKFYPLLGDSLRRHPDAADVLLVVRDRDRHGPLRNFVQTVFKHAGKELLPVLHRALASEDRVARSNAARACGAIGDSASVPLLIKALDMESGLARASIVWALGELEAAEALPKLIAYHQDARNAGKNRITGAGYLASQGAFSQTQRFSALRNLDSIASDWDELRASALRRPGDPRAVEDLLTPELVLEAINKIGPAVSMPFYRSLAGAEAVGDRAEAAVRLAEAVDDRETNLVILRNLAGDPNEQVNFSARVSLAILDEPGARDAIRERLKSKDEQECYHVLKHLSDRPRSRIGFLQATFKELAADPARSSHVRQLSSDLGKDP